jgi:hypothetical protein
MLRAGFWEKVHYSAVFGGGKKQENALDAEFAEARRKDLREIGEEKPSKSNIPGQR